MYVTYTNDSTTISPWLSSWRCMGTTTFAGTAGTEWIYISPDNFAYNYNVRVSRAPEIDIKEDELLAFL